MKKLMATLAIVMFTVVLTSYNINGDDQISGDNNTTQTQEPGGGIIQDVGGI